MQHQHSSVQTTSPETWLSPGSGHWAATSASSPAELVELLSKWLSIKCRKKNPKPCVIVSAFSQGIFPGVFMEHDRGDGPREPGP